MGEKYLIDVLVRKTYRIYKCVVFVFAPVAAAAVVIAVDAAAAAGVALPPTPVWHSEYSISVERCKLATSSSLDAF